VSVQLQHHDRELLLAPSQRLHYIDPSSNTSLELGQLARSNNGWLLVKVDLTAAATGSLDGLDNVQGGLIRDLSKDNVLIIEPAGYNGGNEELRTVGVWSSIGHGEEAWLGVLPEEVLIGELLTVDGLATSSVSAGEVTSL